uniref:EH domain-containing and endocytosis protein 1 n=1 Tax=Talaromyces marneffei PM1 TaxID=1077442 RepID=A0A093V4Y7_TALMA
MPLPQDDSVVMEPPQTPGPVFAIRAFKSAIWGTPAGEESENDRPATTGSPEKPMLRKRNTMPQTIPTASLQQQTFGKPVSDSTNQLSMSPTKSILVTPGTISNRRKTVSFGETAIHGDSERSKGLSRSNSASISPASSVTSQWMSSQSDGKPRPRSRLTQSLLDAKEQSAEEPSKQTKSTRTEESSKGTGPASDTRTSLTEKRDDTMDLEDPQSQSGQYWKTEFENYRKRTNLEISKLIQYRSSARSYARKKDVEAMRLREELRKEEEKVVNMERRVTELASSMMNEKVDHERERLVQDLTRQTALAVQYKHKVDNLRKTLERHGVIGSPDEQPDFEESVRGAQIEVNRLKEALEDANRKLKERNQDDDIKKLQNIAISSERKVSELEKENVALKRTILRVKEEMGKYEERRTEKETKLKLRIEKLDLRCSDYKQKMKEYRVAVHEERNMYRQEIEALKEELAGLSPSRRRVSLDDVRHRLEEKSYAGIHVHDFGGDKNTRNPMDKDDEMLEIIQSIETTDLLGADD